MQPQPHSHEAFFSFSVPPKAETSSLINNNHNNHSQSHSTAAISSNHHHHLHSHHHHHHPHPNLLSPIITSLDQNHHHQIPYNPQAHDLNSTSSPSGSSSLNRPNTAGPFAFNVPPSTASVTSSSTTTQLSPIHSAPSTIPTPSLDRPFSSSALSINTHNLPPPTSHAHLSRPSNLHAANPLKPLGRSSFSALPPPHPSTSHPTPLPVHHLSSHAHHIRPMTAPHAGWPGGSFNEGYDYAPTSASLFGQMPSYHNQQNGIPCPPLTKSASAEAASSNPTTASPAPSPALGTTPHGSSSGPEQDGITADQSPNGPPRRSASSGPDSPDSPDVQPQVYLEPLPSGLRPNTHTGISGAFRADERFLAQPHQPRPTTGHPHLFDPSVSYGHPYPPRQQIFSGHATHLYGTGPAHYSHGPPPVEVGAQERLYNFNILPGAPRKRARRRFDEVERLYECNYPGCTKAYGTLNHLNAHITMQKHGPKRLPQEFKEIRKEWRARKKAEGEARAAGMKQPMGAYGLVNSMEGIRPMGMSGMTGGPNGIRLAGSGSYSAPAHAQQFSIGEQPQRPCEWFEDQGAGVGQLDRQRYAGGHGSVMSAGASMGGTENQHRFSVGSNESGGPPAPGSHHRHPSSLFIHHSSSSIADQS